MHRFSHYELARFDRHRLSKWHAGIRRNRRIIKQDRLFATVVLEHKDETPAGRRALPKRVPLKAPAVVSLSKSYEDTIRVVNSIRKLVLDRRLPTAIYFDEVCDLEAAATLLLTAEIYRCRKLRVGKGGRLLSGTYPKEPAACRRLTEVGFYKLLELQDVTKSQGAKAKADEPAFIRFRTGDRVLPEVADGFLTELLAGNPIMPLLNRRHLFGAIIEAMKNATEHAYEDKTEFDVLAKRWWLAGISDPANHEIVIVLFDQGVGIPRTLDPTRRERVYKLARRLASRAVDGYMIDAATKLHRTSTKRQGRGKGFQTMKKFVDNCNGGELIVYSSKGKYRYTEGKTILNDHLSSLGGTLIQWCIRHPPTPEGEEL